MPHIIHGALDRYFPKKAGDDMKATLETIPVHGIGVEIESETREERRVLERIWNTGGGPAVLVRQDDGNVTLVVAPTVEATEKEAAHGN
ncbi:hypothetical protein LCGC14_1021010 [marine sediment metagenome]|uniref:Uncharacterized protein n=1 Tax=marine sediment metagenome TaxID=412755 RepID=A0A0F9R3C9_9ZZZZ